jgi:hypothetical protein
MKQRGIHNAENRGRGSDSQGNCQDGDGGEARRFAQHAQAVAHVLPEMIPREPAA